LTFLNRLCNDYNQIVIYGAKGWVGRSAVELLFEGNPQLFKEKVLLIGSKSQTANDVNLPAEIFASQDSIKYVEKDVLFLNAAYLRREKLTALGPEVYEKTNDSMTDFCLGLLERKSIKTFINLSSGAAKQSYYSREAILEDSYAKSKRKNELIFVDACKAVNSQLINCRIFNLSGKHINEFKNLALTSFISQAISEPYCINVNSPSTLRTFVDSVDLVKVLFEIGLTGKSLNIDSGGELISLGELAKLISELRVGSRVEIPEYFEKSPDYFGKFSEFNSLASDFGLKLKNMREQVLETFKAF
jgi:nucleoside-diphosphate-sugar epimerase